MGQRKRHSVTTLPGNRRPDGGRRQVAIDRISTRLMADSAHFQSRVYRHAKQPHVKTIGGVFNNVRILHVSLASIDQTASPVAVQVQPLL